MSPVSPAERRTASEPQLIGRILRGERQLFHDLVRPYERAVYVTAYAVLRRREVLRKPRKRRCSRRSATVTFDDGKVKPEQIIKIIEKEGYKAQLQKKS